MIAVPSVYDCGSLQVNTILESVSRQIRQGQREGILRDGNGNKVGSFSISFD